MNLDRWQRLQQLFDEIVELPRQEREIRVRALRSEDPSLAEELAALVHSAKAGTGILESAIGQAARETSHAATGSGDRVGPYRLLHEIGRGGMGTVYLAQRADGQFEQQVAIKLVPAGTLNPRAVGRFRAERQILAQLDHPHIARLLDGGATETGVPYLVMEYVEGEPIDKYCDRLRLTTRQRLELFRNVCAAVEAAHRQLVVHRDLKPSNISVTQEGIPKLLDFGIAKLLEPDEVATGAAMTVAGERVMTPEYASPEQVRAEPVSTATDVYALGLLLYELLTGRRAHRLGSYSPHEVERVVCNTPPERPSTVVTRDAETAAGQTATERSSAAAASQARRTAPLKLKRLLTGDLDNIVLMALRKEPERRYGSVAELSEDIRRHLTGLPVHAHTDSLGYRATKFIERHRLSLTAAAMALVILSGTVIFYTSRLARERDRAQRQAAKASAAFEFLVDVFEVSDPFTSARADADLTAREILERGSARVENEFTDQPELQAAVQAALGRIYRNLGLYADSAPLLERALETYRQLAPADELALASTLHSLAILKNDQGESQVAEELALESLALRRRAVGGDSLESAGSLATVAAALKERGELDAAEGRYRESLEIRRRLAGDQSPEALATLIKLSVLQHAQGHYEAAEVSAREAVAAARAADEQGITLPWAMTTLAAIADQTGQREEAASLFGEAIPRLRELLGNDHPELTPMLRNHATTLAGLDRFAEATALYEEVLAIQEGAFGADHPEVARTSFNLGKLLQRQGRLGEARERYELCVRLIARHLGPEHSHYGRALSGLASLELDEGRPALAERHFREALGVLQATLPASHPHTAEAEVGLGRALGSIDRCREAEPLLRRGLGTLRAQPAEAERVVGQAQSALDDCLGPR